MNLDMNEIANTAVGLWDGSERHLGSFWEEGPLVLVFLRHYG